MSLTEDIKQEEGYRQFPYRCTTGKLTIGYGFNLDDVGLTEEESDAVLEIRLNRLKKQVDSNLFFLEIPDEAWDILYHLAYQIGVAGLMKFKKMILALDLKDYERAADEMLDSLWARQTPNRAKRLSDQMRKLS